MWLYQRTGINFPVLGGRATYDKGVRRQVHWRRIFQAEGLVFEPRFLTGGSNWRKPAKVKAALALAMKG